MVLGPTPGAGAHVATGPARSVQEVAVGGSARATVWLPVTTTESARLVGNDGVSTATVALAAWYDQPPASVPDEGGNRRPSRVTCDGWLTSTTSTR
jgi:hypothetical protein